MNSNDNLVSIANHIRFWVTVAVALIMVYALYVSKDHITHVAEYIGVPGWQAATAFIIVDLPAIIGKVLQLKYFSASTRRVGRKLTYFSGSLSLICNIASGLILGSYGAAGWGAFIVVMFLILENVITKIKPAPAVTRAKNAAPTRRLVRVPQAPAAAPVSPGQPPVTGPTPTAAAVAAVVEEPANVLAFRQAQLAMRRTGQA